MYVFKLYQVSHKSFFDEEFPNKKPLPKRSYIDK